MGLTMDANGWADLEKNGNVGLQYVINPKLYPAMAEALTQTPGENLRVLDCGGGTGALEWDWIDGDPQQILALQNCRNAVNDFRKRVTEIHIIEINRELIEAGQKEVRKRQPEQQVSFYHSNMGTPDTSYPFATESMDLAISRNAVMHLNNEGFMHHLREVHRILKEGAWYVFSTLNPKYQVEQWRASQTDVSEIDKKLYKVGPGEQIAFPHHSSGGGVFTTFHYFRTADEIGRSLQAARLGEEMRVAARPVVDTFKDTHARYYADYPMGLIYGVRKMKPLPKVHSDQPSASEKAS